MVAGDKRRKAKGLPPANLLYILGLVEKALNSRAACLVAFLYLSGRRVSEILHLRASDLTWDDDYLSFRTRIMKRKGHPEETIEIGLRSPAAKLLMPFVRDHIATLDPESYLFPSMRGGHIGYGWAYQIIRAIEPAVWPHWFRHMRLTHVAEVMNIYELTEFAKWADIRPAVDYIHVRDMRKKLQKV